MGCASSSPSSTANPLPAAPSKRKIDITPEMLASMTEEEIMAMEMGSLNFFKKVKSVDTSRDYTIIVDASGSMFPNRWEQAKNALQHLAPSACKCDPGTLHSSSIYHANFITNYALTYRRNNIVLFLRSF